MVERKGMSTIRGWSKNVENLYLLILMILYSLTPATGIYLPQTQSSPQVAKMVLFLGTSGSRHAERYQQGHRPRARGRSPRQAPAVLTVSGIILRWIKSTCHRFWRILALPIVVLWLWLSLCICLLQVKVIPKSQQLVGTCELGARHDSSIHSQPLKIMK